MKGIVFGAGVAWALCLALQGAGQPQEKNTKGTLGPREEREAVALVKSAVAYLKAQGRDKFTLEVNSGTGRFHMREKSRFYIFVFDMQGRCVAHGFNVKLVGMEQWDLRDPDGVFLMRELVKAAQAGGGWVRYKYYDPVTGRIAAKVSYVESWEGLGIGSGYYR